LVAIGDGEVVYATNEGSGFGNTVTIRLDGGPKVGYGHMARIDVAVGLRVVSGQQIGMSGGGVGMEGAGTSNGPHLHLWMGEGPNPPGVIDPTQLLSVFSGEESGMTVDELKAVLAQWMQDQTALVIKDIHEQVDGKLGVWEKETRTNINAHIDAKIDEVLTAIRAG